MKAKIGMPYTAKIGRILFEPKLVETCAIFGRIQCWSLYGEGVPYDPFLVEYNAHIYHNWQNVVSKMCHYWHVNIPESRNGPFCH